MFHLKISFEQEKRNVERDYIYTFFKVEKCTCARALLLFEKLPFSSSEIDLSVMSLRF